MDDRKHGLESAIDALEAQRRVLGDGVALAHAEGLIALTEAGDDSLEGADEVAIRWVCHRVLAAAGDARADAALATAHAALEARAAVIADLELRESFLEAIPEHCAIRAAWAARRRH